MNVLRVLVFILPVLGILAAILVGRRTMKTTGNAKKAVTRHIVTFAMCLVLCLGFTMLVSAETTMVADDSATTTITTEAVESQAVSGSGLAVGLALVGSGLAIGLSALGAGIALSGGAPAAIGAVSEDPKSFGKSMIFVVLGEALAIYGFIIAFFIILRLTDLVANMAAIIG